MTGNDDGDNNDDVEDSVRAVVATTDYVLRELAATQEAIRDVAQRAGVRAPAGLPAAHASTDRLWTCRSCGTRLAVYAPPPEDILRLKHKDLLVLTKIGAGGYVTVFCRSCGAENTQEFSS